MDFNPYDIADDDPVYLEELAKLRGGAKKQNDPGFVTGIKQGLGGFTSGVGQVAEDLGWKNNPIKSYGDEVQANNPSSAASQSWEGFKGSPWQGVKEFAGQGIGSTLPSLAAFLLPGGQGAAATGLARVGQVARGLPMQTALAAAPIYGQVREDQQHQGFDDIPAAAAAAIGGGIVESKLGIQRVLGKATDKPIQSFVGELASSPLKTGLKTWGRTGLEEGAEEIIQQPMQQLGAHRNPLTEESLRDTAWSGFGGLIGGLAMGGVGGAKMGLAHKRVDTFRQADLLNPETPLDLLDKQAQWNQAFIERDQGAEAGQRFYDQRQGEIDQYVESLVDPYRRQAFADQNRQIDLLADQERIAARAPSYLGQQSDYNPDDERVLNAVDRPNAADYRNWWENVPDPNNPEAYQQFWQHVTDGQESVRDVKRDALGTPLNQELPPGYVPVSFRSNGNATTQVAQESGQGASGVAGGSTGNTQDQPGVGRGGNELAAAPVLGSGTDQSVGDTRVGNGAGVNVTEPAQVVAQAQKANDAKAGTKSGTALAAQGVKPGTKGALEAAVTELMPEESTERQDHINAIQTAKSYTAARKALAKMSPQGLKIALRSAPQEEQRVVQTALGWDAQGNQVGSRIASYADVAKAVGLNSRQRVQQILKSYGIDSDVINRMNAADQQAVSVSELMPSQQEDGGAQDGTGFRIMDNPNASDDIVDDRKTRIETQLANKFAAEQGVTAKDLANGAVATADEAPEVVRNRQEAARKSELAMLDEARAIAGAYAEEAMSTWNEIAESASPQGPAFHTISPKDQVAWLLEYKEFIGEHGDEKFEEYWPKLVKLYDEYTSVTQVNNESGQIETARTAGFQSIKGTDTGATSRVERLGVQSANTGEQTQDTARPEQTGSAEGSADGVKQSRGVEGSTQASAIESKLKPLFFSNSRFSSRVVVVQSATALPQNLQSAIDGNTQAFVQGGKVYMIADNIAEGKELAVFLHEVGVHLGMKGLIGQENLNRLAMQIKRWATNNDGSVESELAKKALARVKSAQQGGVNMELGDVIEERVAYFVEEAVNAGINPTALSKSGGPLQQWFRTMWAAVKTALRKFGLDRVHTLTAQNLVDLSYGAARLELEGTWHGTAADFRNFNHEYMGSGEGAQAFGWGTYLAQRPGIAKGYWKDDVVRKTNRSKNKYTYDGKEFFENDNSPQAEAVIQLERLGSDFLPDGTMGRDDFDAIVSNMLDDVRMAKYNSHHPAYVKALTDAYRGIKNLDPSKFKYEKAGRPEGSLMRVDTAVHEDEMLDWDKPLSEQSEVVKEALASDVQVTKVRDGVWRSGGKYVVEENGSFGVYNDWEDDYPKAKFKTLEAAVASTNDNSGSGESYYRQLQNRLGSDKAASEYLDSIGIKGIKFLDSQSRGFSGKWLVDAGGRTVSAIEASLSREKRSTLGVDHREIKDALQFVESFDSLDEALEEAIGKSGPFGHAYGMSVNAKIIKAWKELGWNLGSPSQTRNLVIFNDKNIQRVVTQVGADRERIKFSFAGKNAETVDPDKLSKAESLEKAGVDQQSIWEQTGWYRGADNAWRFEISDNDASFTNKGNNLSEILGGVSKKLGVVLNHPELFKAYPKLRSVDVSPVAKAGHGKYSSNNGYPKINLDPSMPADEALSVLMHEVQHAIQEIENFARGGNPSIVAADMAERSELLAEVGSELNTAVTDIRSELGADAYRSLLRKVRDEGYRYSHVAFQLGTVDEDAQDVAEIVLTAAKELGYDRVAKAAEAYLTVSEELVQPGSFIDKEKRAFDMYQRLAGEVEARNVQARIGQNNKVNPRGTEDTSTERQIVKFSGGESSSIKFSKTAQAVKQYGGESGVQAWEDASGVASRAFKWFMSLHDLVGKYGGVLPSAKGWYDSVRATAAARNRIKEDAESIAARAGKLNKVVLKQLNEFISKSTYEQKWGYDATFDKLDGTKRDVKADPEMAKLFRALPKDAQEIAKAVFAHGEKMKVEKFKIMKHLGLDKDTFLEQGSLTGPYAPLKRFGDYVAILKSKELRAAEQAGDTKKVEELKANPDHYVVSNFDTLGQAKKFARANEATFGWSDAFKGSINVEVGHRMKPETLQKVLAAVKAEDLPSNVKGQVETMVREMYLSAFDEHNARMSGLKRKNRAGYDADMIRSFLAHARAEAGFLSNMQHGGKTNELFYKLQQEAKNDDGKRAGQDVFNAIAQHYAANLDHKDTPIQDRVLAFTSIMQLATNPAYHIQNLMQPLMVSVPRLAADFNDYGGAWNAMRQGHAISREMVKGNIFKLETEIDLSVVKNTKLREMLQTAADAGLLDVGMDEDLANFESTRTGYELVDNASNGMKKIVHKLRQMSRRVEATNRISAAVAAYNMSYGRNKDHAKATEYAISVLQDTQGDFSKTDAPLIIKRLPKFMVQYRKFQLMMAAHYVKAFNDAFRKLDEAELAGMTAEQRQKAVEENAKLRAVGRRTLLISLGHALGSAGVMGLPLMNVIGLIFKATGSDDEPRDLERSLREMFGDNANYLLRGPFWFMGLDAKLSQDKVFSFMPYADWDLTSRKGGTNLLVGLTGPSGSNALRMMEGFGKMAEGDYYKGLTGILPSGLANGIKAFQVANKGYTLKNGDVMVKPEDIETFQLMLDSIGMKSPEMRRMDWYKNQQWEVKQFYSDRSKEIQREYAEAFKEKDTAQLAELRQDWMDLQAGKDRLRYLFGDNHDELKRQPLSNLIKYPQTVANRERKLQRSVVD